MTGGREDKRPWLLMPGGLAFMEPAIRAAHRCGLRVATLDYLPDNPAHKISDLYINADVTDHEAVKRAAEGIEASGILVFAVDPATETAARVAESLSLPFAGSAEAVGILQNKDRFRKFLGEHGFNVPHTFDPDDISGIKFPVMVKPVDSAGSKGVRLVKNANEMADAVAGARRISRRGRVIAEEYIEAEGFPSDCEMFLLEGKVEYCSFSSQWFDPEAENPFVPAAFTWGDTFTAAQREEARSELQRVADLLHLRTGLFNVELRFDKGGSLYLMEVSPRAGGNRLAEMMEIIDGVPLIESAVKAAVGKIENLKSGIISRSRIDTAFIPDDRHSKEHTRKGCKSEGYANVILHAPESGKFKGLDVSPGIREFIREIHLTVTAGDNVSAFTGANAMIGNVMMQFPDAATARRIVREILEEKRHLRVEID